MNALLVNPDASSLPPGTIDLARDIGWNVTQAGDYGTALKATQTDSIDVVIIALPPSDEGQDKPDPGLRDLMRRVDVDRVATVVIGGDQTAKPGHSNSSIDRLGAGVTLDELRGRFSMIDRYHARFCHMEKELHNMERMGKRLNQHFREVDEEMRLAARLQRDFLPRLRQPIRDLRFASIFRPATWVSGDIFDVFRIDEDHTAFYIADAVGHGVAASLLTMFIKRSIVSKRVSGDSYTLLSPAETLTILNDALAEQALPNCQFVTACYGYFNHKTRRYRFARGGHPYPLLITRDGTISELKATGGLLGLFPGEEFTETELELEPGDKLLLYTDGVELAFDDPNDATKLDTMAYMNVFRDAATESVEPMIRRIEAVLDEQHGSLNPRDDVTIIGVEVLANEHSGPQ